MKNNLENLDQISLEYGQVQCIVGVLPHERQNVQRLDFGLTFFVDTRWAAETRSLEDTIDYASMKALAEEFLIEKKFKLLETAAHELAELFLGKELNHQNRIKAVRISLAKPGAFEDSAVPRLTVVRHWDEF